MRDFAPNYSDRHIAQQGSVIADRAELHALRLGTSVVEDGLTSDRIAAAEDDFDARLLDPENWHADDLRNEGGSGIGLENVVRRRALLGDSYPFDTRDASLEYRPSDNLVYEFCLAISTAPQITKRPFVRLPRIFERLSCRLAETYLGHGGRAHHTGWPRTRKSQRFRGAVKTLSDKTGEWVWQPEIGMPQDPPLKDIKDCGIDLVAWKEVDDRRGQLFLLGQCACGDNWRTKFGDVSVNRLRPWFHPMTLIYPPGKAFFTPHHAVDPILDEASREAGIVLDRVRLTLLAARCEGLYSDQTLRAQLEDVVALVRDG